MGMDKNPGGQREHESYPSHDVTASPLTLEDLGINRMQNQIAEIKIYAERRAGELLMGMKKQTVGRPAKKLSHDVTNLGSAEKF